MCMGYAKEIRAWVCDDARTRNDLMMQAWGRVLMEPDGQPETSLGSQPQPFGTEAMEHQPMESALLLGTT